MAKRRGIYKRGNVYWIRYAGLDGKIAYESSGSSRFKDAEALLIKRKESIQQGKQPEVRKIKNRTFGELVEEYSKWAERQRSYRSKSYIIQDLSDTFGNLPLRRFNTMLVEQFQSERLNQGYKPATVNRRLATLKHMFTKAVDWEMVEEDTLKRVRKVLLLEENNRRLRYLSLEECQRLVANCDPHLLPIVITALNTGMRKAEILSLRWDSNIDLKHGLILLEQTKNGERREVPVSDALEEMLRKLPRRLDVPHVFYDPKTGKPYANVRKSFISACRRAGVKDFHFHDLRHTFASHLVMNGVDLVTVKELLGHKTLTMTLRYAHLAPSHRLRAVNILSAALAGVRVDEKAPNGAVQTGAVPSLPLQVLASGKSFQEDNLLLSR